MTDAKVRTAEFVKSASTYTECPPPKRPEFAFIGRSNVGKSSLINMLCERKALAKTSGTPGKTQLINHFLINEEWFLVDLPGYGYAKVSKKSRKGFEGLIKDYIEKRENLVNLFVLIDSRHLPQANDLEFMEWLGIQGVPFSIIFTKLDKLSSTEWGKNQLKYKKRLLQDWSALPKIFASSAETGYGRTDILAYIDALSKELKDRFV
jgi:GTP-binding protein